MYNAELGFVLSRSINSGGEVCYRTINRSFILNTNGGENEIK